MNSLMLSLPPRPIYPLYSVGFSFCLKDGLSSQDLQLPGEVVVSGRVVILPAGWGCMHSPKTRIVRFYSLNTSFELELECISSIFGGHSGPSWNA